ncbi:MAG TPA: A24 family peptidase C-terminal domain-containing protein [Candidatus Acidoferrum sp.]|nr:A24 family peptidase C-terminal domain-containing protein [Candidatus Acidoferrum sp.]
MIDVLTLDVIGLVASFTFLTYSSWSDIVSREVSDRVWMIFYPAGLALTVIRLIVQTGSWLEILLSISITVAISLLLPYLGLWGGADGKGFICLALMNPVVPAVGGNLLHIVDPFFPLVVFCNAYVASLLALLYPIQRNVRMRRRQRLFEGLEDESSLHKATALLTGYKVPVGELESKPHLFLLESIRLQESTVKRRLEFNLRVDLDKSEELAEIRRAADSGLLGGGIWVSPGLPFLVFVTLGLAISVLLGDVVWSLVSTLMRGIVGVF